MEWNESAIEYDDPMGALHDPEIFNPHGPLGLVMRDLRPDNFDPSVDRHLEQLRSRIDGALSVTRFGNGPRELHDYLNVLAAAVNAAVIQSSGDELDEDRTCTVYSFGDTMPDDCPERLSLSEFRKLLEDRMRKAGD